MEQTFLNFVLTDLRFWASSASAILRSLLVPMIVVVGGFGLALGTEAAVAALLAGFVWAVADWALLVVRMARRIALGQENPNALLDRSVAANAAYLHRAYYAG